MVLQDGDGHAQASARDGEVEALDARFGIVVANRFEVQARDGSTRVEIGVDENDGAVLRMLDAAGTVRAVVTLQDDTPGFRLLDAAGHTRLSGNLRDDQPGLEFVGSDGIPRMILCLRDHEDEGPDVYFIDRKGHPRFGVAMDRDGNISLARENEAGRVFEPDWCEPELWLDDEPLEPAH